MASDGGFFWFYGGDDGWQLFGDEHQDIIERARIQGEDYAIIHIGQSAYMINFTDGIQENMANGNRRPISRARESTVWFWRGNDGNWNLYSKDHAEILTRAEAGRESEAYLMIGQTLYRIDLARRVQINFENGNRREIRLGRGPSPRLASDPPAEQQQQQQQHEVDDEDITSEAPRPFLCPISMNIMRDPVITSAGSTYERNSIEEWMKKHKTDPLTKKNIDSHLVPDRALRENILQWRNDFFKEKKPVAVAVDVPKQKNTRLDEESSASAVESNSTVNDTLKVIVLGNDKVGTTSIIERLVRGRAAILPCVDSDNSPPSIRMQHWQLPLSPAEIESGDLPLRFNFWDFEGRDVFHDHRAMFFSPQTLYVIVWDMGVSDARTSRTSNHDIAADEALRRDIATKVQFWVDLIQTNVPSAVILIVASFCDVFSANQKLGQGSHIGENESKRRCRILRKQIVAPSATILYGPDADDPLVRVSGTTSVGLDVLKDAFKSIASNKLLFERMGEDINKMCLQLRKAVRSHKANGHKMIDVDTVRHEMGGYAGIDDALVWLFSVGEIFPLQEEDQVGMIVLDIPWFSRFSGCMLVKGWSALVRRGRQLLGKGETNCFAGAVNGNYPLISLEDCQMLWQNAIETSYAGDAPLLAFPFDILPVLLVRFGILVPIEKGNGPLALQMASIHAQTTYLPDTRNYDPNNMLPPADLMMYIPSLLETGDAGAGPRTHMAQASDVVAAQVVDFLDYVPIGLMQRIIGAVFLHIDTLIRCQRTLSERGVQFSSVRTAHCWQSILQVKCVATDSNGEQSVVEIYSQLLHSSLDHNGDKVKSRLYTSANEIRGDGGRYIWEAGYGLVLETIRYVLATYQNLQHAWRSLCPQCLVRRDILTASSWPCDGVHQAVTAGERLICLRQHRPNMRLLHEQGDFETTASFATLASRMKQSVVLLGLYDSRQPKNKIRKLGSGFIVDSERGIIMTAARTFMRIAGRERFGTNYFGLVGAKIVVGVNSPESGSAVFRYSATIFAKDPAISDPRTMHCRVDACVLKITSRFENDVAGNGDDCQEEIEILLRDNAVMLKAQQFVPLPLSFKSELEENVCVYGYEQIESDDNVVNRNMNSSSGYISQHLAVADNGPEEYKYQPRRLTVIMSEAKVGHTGGPCVNERGEVVGLLSCADPNESETRSFVVPVSEWQGWFRS